MGFIDTLRSEGHAVESICRVLRQQGCQVAARTYREWRRPSRPVAARTITDAQVVDLVRSLAWTIDPVTGRRRMTPEGLYGRRKMTAVVRRRLPAASAGSLDRAMRTLGLPGVRRAKVIRTTIPAKDGKRAQDLLNRDFTAPAPNEVWVKRVRPEDPRLARPNLQTGRAGHHTAADGPVGTRPGGSPPRPRATDRPLRCRVAIRVAAIH